MGIAVTTASAAPKQLSDQNSQGTVLGYGATDLIGFYSTSNANCVAQSTIVGALTMAGSQSTALAGSSFAFSSATITAAIVNAVQQLKLMGLIG